MIPLDRKTMLTEGWVFHGWDTIPGKDPNFPDFSFSENTVLPHRIPFPNSNIWYSNQIKLDEGYLWIRADDGAQLWVNGKQVLQNHELYFPIEKNPINTRFLQIRVMNNALSGGLKEEYWIDKLTFDAFREKKRNSESKLIQKAKDNFWIGGSLPPKRNDYSIWFNDPVILPIENDRLMLRWIGEKNKKAKLHFGHKPNTITES
jgi:hypothetical protein